MIFLHDRSNVTTSWRVLICGSLPLLGISDRISMTIRHKVKSLNPSGRATLGGRMLTKTDMGLTPFSICFCTQRTGFTMGSVGGEVGGDEGGDEGGLPCPLHEPLNSVFLFLELTGLKSECVIMLSFSVLVPLEYPLVESIGFSGERGPIRARFILQETSSVSDVISLRLRSVITYR